MAAPSIILAKGQILIQQGGSYLGIFPSNNNKVRFGYVVAVYSTSDKTTVGTSIMYDPTNSQDFMYGSTMYSIINEQSITGKEDVVI